MITVGNDLIRNHLHQEHKWFVVFGVLCVVLGLALFAILPLATLSVVYFFGILMMLVGMLHLVAAFSIFKSNSRWFLALFSIFYFLAGYFAFSSPDKTAVVLTSLLSVFLLFAGAIRMASASMLKSLPSWKWSFFSGALTCLAGLLILLSPTASFWVLGLFLATDVLVQGINYLTIAKGIKQLPESSKTVL